MNIFLEEDNLEEIKPLERSDDNAIVINPTVGKREEGLSDLMKEIIANDAMEIGPSEASKIHSVPASSASKYKDGKDISDDDTRARVLANKYGIENTATVKLMETLNLINPHTIDKPRDQIALITGLSNLIDKISGKEREGNKTVHLHLYGPNQKSEKDYDVIDV